MMPSFSTPLIAARTKSDWSANSCTSRSEVTVDSTRGSCSFTLPDDVERGGRAAFHDGDERAALRRRGAPHSSAD